MALISLTNVTKTYPPAQHPLREYSGKVAMSLAAVVIAVIAIILLITGGIVQSLNFLLWVGVVLLVVAVIAFLLRTISGRK